MSIRRQIQRAALFAGLVVTIACGGSEAPPAENAPAEPPASAPEAAPPPAAAPRVFFVEPKDGSTVKSPVHIVFGIESYQLSPVPEGATAENARAGMGHHHIAVDADCLPTGTPVPTANPWRHFGAGQTEVDMPLQPGAHRLTLQLGDDAHRAIEGLCSTINVTVE
jgi:hypothetical protein